MFELDFYLHINVADLIDVQMNSGPGELTLAVMYHFRDLTDRKGCYQIVDADTVVGRMLAHARKMVEKCHWRAVLAQRSISMQESDKPTGSDNHTESRLVQPKARALIR